MFIYTVVNTASLYNYNVGEAFDAWLELHQIYYQGAIFLGFMALFSTSTWIFVGALIFGFLSQYFGFIDETLHRVFIDWGIYKMMGVPGFSSNPQYAKLLFYALAFLALGVKFLYKRTRTLKIAFVLLVMTVNILVVALNHKMLPSGFMRDLVIERMTYLKSFAQRSGINLIEACNVVRVYCEVEQKEKLISEIEINEKDKSYLAQFTHLDFAQGSFLELVDMNTNPNILIISRTPKNELFRIYDNRYPKQQWERSVGYFSFNCFFVSFAWYFVIIGFFYIHRRVDKNI
jgi:hypothetical protein